MIKKINLVVKNPKLIAYYVLYKFMKWIPDKPYLKIKYYLRTGKRLNWDHITLFNEKLQWLKLYDRNPFYTRIADKYEFRNYIAETIGEKYLIPLLGVWDDFDEINFESFPNRFVLKCTHDSASVVICTDKNSFNFKKAKKHINKCLKQNYYYLSREWPYKNIKPRIIAEEYLEESSGQLTDYKIYCFSGKPKLAQVIFDRYTNKTNNTYSLPEWKLLPINISTNSKFDPKHDIPCPDDLPAMIEICNILSYDIPYVRVDFYYIGKKIYIGEMTLTPAGGFLNSDPDMGELWGSWITLPNKECKRQIVRT